MSRNQRHQIEFLMMPAWYLHVNNNYDDADIICGSCRVFFPTISQYSCKLWLIHLMESRISANSIHSVLNELTRQISIHLTQIWPFSLLLAPNVQILCSIVSNVINVTIAVAVIVTVAIITTITQSVLIINSNKTGSEHSYRLLWLIKSLIFHIVSM